MKRVIALLISLILLGTTIGTSSAIVLVTAPEPPIIIVGNVPSGHSLPAGQEFEVYFMVADDFGVTVDPGFVKAYYRINGGQWREAYLRTTPDNDVIRSIRARYYGNGTQNFYVFYYRFTVPKAQAGSKIEYYVMARDVEKHVSVSPVYTYYVSNPNGPRLLIVDPSVDAIGYEPALDSLVKQFNASRNYYMYNLSDFEAVADPLLRLNASSALDLIKTHHWEFLAKTYNIYIVSPGELSEALQEFQPDAVLLSNLWIPGWGLSEEEMRALRDYLRSSHAGLVVTAGTLLDATNPGNVGTPGKVSVATMLRMEPLQLAGVIRDALNIPDVPLMTPAVNTGHPLVTLNREPFSGGKFELNVSTVVGWQYFLPENPLGIAERSLSRFVHENNLRFREIGTVVSNFTGARFNFSAAASLALPKVLLKVSVSDDGITVEHNGTAVSVELNQKYVEKLRLLHAVRGRYPVLLAHTTDYSGAVLASYGDYKAVYVSLELEAGGSDEFSILKKIIGWSMVYKTPETPEVVVLANDIDWGIRGGLLAAQLESLGLKVKRVTPAEFDAYRDSHVIVILGGPDAYDGVGGYVRQVLSLGEQNAVREGKGGMFVKADVWTGGQVVIVLAGKDRWGTGEKVSTYANSVDEDYLDLLKGFVASVS